MNQLTNNIMIRLSELSDISNGNEEQKRIQKQIREKEKEDIYENQFREAVSNLEQRLKESAIKGKKELKIAHFSIHNFIAIKPNITSEFKKILRLYGNLYVAIRDSEITEIDIIKSIDGNLKRVYNFLTENGLNPIIKCWDDGSGGDEGFQLIVQW